MATPNFGGSGGPSAKPDPLSPANPAELPKSWSPRKRSRGGRAHPSGQGTGPLRLLGSVRGRSPPQAQPCGPRYTPRSRSVPPAQVSTDGHHRARRSLLPRQRRAGDELRASARARVLFADVGKVQIEPPAVLVPRSPKHRAPLRRLIITPSPAPAPKTHPAGSRAPGPGRHGPPKPSRAKTQELCKTRGRDRPVLDCFILGARSSGTG